MDGQEPRSRTGHVEMQMYRGEILAWEFFRFRLAGDDMRGMIKKEVCVKPGDMKVRDADKHQNAFAALIWVC